MSVPNDSEDPTPESGLRVGPIAVVAVVLAVLLGVLLYYGSPAPEPAPTVADSVPVEVPEAPAPAPEPEPEPEAERAAPRRRTAAEPVPEPELEPEPVTTAEIRIVADVPGASVFLDRVYLGTSPVTARDVAPGSHMLNVSADGHDGYAETIEVVPGSADIVVSLKTVRLDEAIDVVHKHRFGSCQGRLVATPAGIRYVTDHKDAFTVTLQEIEVLEIDYLDKTLRFEPRGGRAYNFSGDNADALFLFQEAVNIVRERLAAGG